MTFRFLFLCFHFDGCPCFPPRARRSATSYHRMLSSNLSGGPAPPATTRGHCVVPARGSPRDLSDYHRAQPETVACLAGHSHRRAAGGRGGKVGGERGAGDKRTTAFASRFICRVRLNVSEEGLSSPRAAGGARHYHAGREIAQVADVRRGNKIKGYQRNPVIARRLTVSPASKPRHLFCALIRWRLLRSAQPLLLPHEGGRGRGRAGGVASTPLR